MQAVGGNRPGGALNVGDGGGGVVKTVAGKKTVMVQGPGKS